MWYAPFVAQLACPKCRQRLLDPTQVRGVEIDVCQGCGGLWFDHLELERVILADEDPIYPRLEKGIVAELGAKKAETAWLCPRCRHCLTTYAICSEPSLEVDVCEACHGIWLDRGELATARLQQELPRATAAVERPRTTGTWLFQFFTGLPVEYNIKPRRIPMIVVGLILLNVAAFGLELLAAGHLESFVRTWGLTPANLNNLHGFLTLITSQFLHGGVIHLGVNMYFLYILGDNVEDVLGRVPFLLFYLVCGAAGGVVHAALTTASAVPAVGASGAIAGVMGAYVMLFRRAKLTFMFVVIQRKLSVFWYGGIWVAGNLLGAFLGGFHIAYLAHLGGFATGMLVGRVIYSRAVESYPLLKYLNTQTKRSTA